jgi:hypothetical protein
MDDMFHNEFIKLTETWESDHFVVRYGKKNPRVGRGLSTRGIGDFELLGAYRSSLEDLYASMTGDKIGRSHPLEDNEKIPVYVMDTTTISDGVDPLTSYDRHSLKPFIIYRADSKIVDVAMLTVR